jgi:hypothetical protein
MKKLTLLLAGIFIYSLSNAQIQILPEIVQSVVSNKQANISSSGKPYWIGTSGSPHMHLDSGLHHKIGIGVGHKSGNFPTSPIKFEEHAKVHIRHAGGPSSTETAQKGPHLLLDEATSDRSAVIRFRQSTLELSGTFGDIETITPGARYWDVRGFGNSSILGGDEFRIVNSGATEDLLKIDGDGDFKFSGEGSTRLQIKGPADNNPVKLEFGQVGEASNRGRIWYNNATNVMQVFSDGAASLTIDDGRVGIGSVNPGTSKLYVDGYTTLGDHAQAPKIKTWLGTANLPTSHNSQTNHNILPVSKERILSCNIMVTNDEGYVVCQNVAYIASSYFFYKIDGTTISLFTGDNYDSSRVIGESARIFVTYTD